MVNGSSLGKGRVRRNGPPKLVFKVINSGRNSGTKKSRLIQGRRMRRQVCI